MKTTETSVSEVRSEPPGDHAQTENPDSTMNGYKEDKKGSENRMEIHVERTSENSSPRSTDISSVLQAGRLKNLAELIGLCRDTGIQVYSDKVNVPEAEKQRLEELRKSGVNPETEKGHRSDHLDPKDPRAIRREKRKVSSLKPLADVIIVNRIAGKQIFNDTPNVPESDKMRQLELQKEITSVSRGSKRGSESVMSRSSKSRRSGGASDTTLSRTTSLRTTSRKSSVVSNSSPQPVKHQIANALHNSSIMGDLVD